MKIAVVTSIIGNDPNRRDKLSDNLTNPEIIHSGVDYFAFVKDECDSSLVWECIKPLEYSVIDKKFSNRRNAKIYKILPQLFIPGYDMYIWCDPTHEILAHPKELYKKMNDSGVEAAFFRHAKRNSIYEELNYIKTKCRHLDHSYNLENYENFIKGYNISNVPLYTCSVFATLNTRKCQSFRLTWNEIINKYSSRDQLSCPLSVQINKLPNIVLYDNLEDISTSNIWAKRTSYHV